MESLDLRTAGTELLNLERSRESASDRILQLRRQRFIRPLGSPDLKHGHTRIIHHRDQTISLGLVELPKRQAIGSSTQVNSVFHLPCGQKQLEGDERIIVEPL